MKHLNLSAEQEFLQALKCVEYRLPNRYRLSGSSLAATLGLRYGLVACATAHHLLMSDQPVSERAVKQELSTLCNHISAHLEMLPRDFRNRLIGHEKLVVSTTMDVLNLYVPQYRWLFALDLSLSMIVDQFTQSHKCAISPRWRLFGRWQVRREFHTAANESYAFALAFYERRIANLEEVPEIALLGE